MSRIKYYFERLFEIDWKNMFGVVGKISKRCHKPYILILFDTIWCSIKYGASCHTRGVLKYYKESIGWFETTTIDNGFVGYFVQEGILGTVGFCTLLVSIIRLSNKGG